MSQFALRLGKSAISNDGNTFKAIVDVDAKEIDSIWEAKGQAVIAPLNVQSKYFRLRITSHLKFPFSIGEVILEGPMTTNKGNLHSSGVGHLCK